MVLSQPKKQVAEDSMSTTWFNWWCVEIRAKSSSMVCTLVGGVAREITEFNLQLSSKSVVVPNHLYVARVAPRILASSKGVGADIGLESERRTRHSIIL